MQIISIGDNLHGTKAFFLGKIRKKYFKMASADFFLPRVFSSNKPEFHKDGSYQEIYFYFFPLKYTKILIKLAGRCGSNKYTYTHTYNIAG